MHKSVVFWAALAHANPDSGCKLSIFVLTWHSSLAQTFPMASKPSLLTMPQYRQIPTLASCTLAWATGTDKSAEFDVVSRNSTSACSVALSARASSQNSLVRPHPSCRSTLIASSSSLHTYPDEKIKTLLFNDFYNIHSFDVNEFKHFFLLFIIHSK